MKSVLLIAGLALALTACAVTDRGQGLTDPAMMEPPHFGEGDDVCGAAGRDYLVGQSINEVDLDTLARTIRTIYPGQMVTMDHRPDRLNIDVGEAGKILRLWCG